VAAGTSDGKAWRSSDGGDTWTDISSGLPYRTINDLTSDPADPSRLFCVTGGFGSPHLYEYEVNKGWIARGNELPDVPTNTVVARTSGDVYVGNDVGLFRSRDGGITFQPFMEGLPLGVVVTDIKYSELTETFTLGTYGRGAWQRPLQPDAQVPALGRGYSGLLILLLACSLALIPAVRTYRTKNYPDASIGN